MKQRLLLSLVLLVAMAAALLPGNVAQAAGIVNVAAGPGCELRVTFSVTGTDPTGDYLVEVWDDGVLMAATKVNVGGAGVYTTVLFVSNPSDWKAAGMGIFLYDPTDYASHVDMVDPYYPTGLDPMCGAGPDMVPLPPQAVVGAVKSTTDTYWAPNADAMTGITLEAGKTVWVLGMDAGGMYYKIVLAGKYLWVPQKALGPNYDAVWGGAPLPTTVVQ